MALLLIAALSAFGGYNSGVKLRQEAELTEVARIAQEQFTLGLQEMQQGQYYRARQRFEYVIQLDPNYPGVTEKLADVLLELNTTATPTLVPTPTLTPTPDLRGEQELYDQGKQYLASGDWDSAIDALLSLRKRSPGFQTVEVDGMIFIALRNRGKDKITKDADLEGGIYDLTLAERFGPLDSEAQAFLTWTTMYITGASFWDIDWEQAVYYFEQVAPQMPSLTDGSGYSATERLRIALYEHGNALARDGKACKAMAQYTRSLEIGYNAQVEAALNAAAKACQGGGQPESPPPAPGGGGGGG
jgi:tetratricopeptide (TPR) repeat protein